jgi:hypothetical protein
MLNARSGRDPTFADYSDDNDNDDKNDNNYYLGARDPCDYAGR